MEEFDLLGIKIFVNENHRFGTDAFLLADFAGHKPSDKVADLCTGCGIIPLIMCREKPPKEIYGIEIMGEAVELFNQSVIYNNLSDRVHPVLCDLKNVRDIKQIPKEYFDIVTVNPPYWKKGSGEERLSPVQAAARHEILCDINDVINAASALLKYGGSLKLCQIPSRLCDVVCAMRERGIEPKTLRMVCNKQGDKPWLFLISGKKGGKPGLEIERDFIVYGDDGQYTPEMQRIYSPERK